MSEEYKKFNKNYEISNIGNIKNTTTNRILKLRKNHNGYLGTNISIDGKLKTVFAHRLVAETFIPNPDNLPCVNHKDENKTNNCVDNLEWCTYKYNSNYKDAQKRKAQRTWKKVYKYDKDGNFIEEYNSVTELAKKLNCNTGAISQVCSGKRKTYKGFIYKY